MTAELASGAMTALEFTPFHALSGGAILGIQAQHGALQTEAQNRERDQVARLDAVAWPAFAREGANCARPNLLAHQQGPALPWRFW